MRRHPERSSPSTPSVPSISILQLFKKNKLRHPETVTWTGHSSSPLSFAWERFQKCFAKLYDKCYFSFTSFISFAEDFLFPFLWGFAQWYEIKIDGHKKYDEMATPNLQSICIKRFSGWSATTSTKRTHTYKHSHTPTNKNRKRKLAQAVPFDSAERNEKNWLEKDKNTETGYISLRSSPRLRGTCNDLKVASKQMLTQRLHFGRALAHGQTRQTALQKLFQLQPITERWRGRGTFINHPLCLGSTSI